MDNSVLAFWFVVIASVSAILVTLRRGRAASRGWLVVHGLTLTIAIAGYFFAMPALIYCSLSAYLLLVLVPGVLSKFYFESFLQQRYSRAARFARAIAVLHPGDGWPQQVRLIRALQLAQGGDLDSAVEVLKRYKGNKTIIGVAALVHLYRVTNQWDALLAWLKEEPEKLESFPQLLPTLLRAYGETGAIPAMLDLYQRNESRIARLAPASMRDLCRLVLFAFCGRRDHVETVLVGSLSMLPETTKSFWLATADIAAGNSDTAAAQLRELAGKADSVQRRAIERRLAQAQEPPPILDDSASLLLEEAVKQQAHDHAFGGQRPLLSKDARAVQLVLVLNVLAYAVEMLTGGSTNYATLYRLGALYPPAVFAGEWWRLIASSFLHFGPLHLVMNMLGLWVLGPFVEFALGFGRFLTVYLLAGIGSMLLVMLIGSGMHQDQLTVGASGAIMSLVGATGAIMLRGWLSEGAPAARRRLVVVLSIILMQTTFDALVPMVSMTGHLSGVVFGFLLTIPLRHKLLAGT